MNTEPKPMTLNDYAAEAHADRDFSSSNCLLTDSDSLQQATERWVDFVIEYHRDNKALTQVHVKGFFAGMSERDIVGFAKQLKANAEKYPVWKCKQEST